MLRNVIAKPENWADEERWGMTLAQQLYIAATLTLDQNLDHYVEGIEVLERLGVMGAGE